MNVGDNHVIADTMDGVVYPLWGTKEPDYVMRVMASGGPCKEAVRKWTKKVGMRWYVSLGTPAPLTGTVIVTPLMIATTFAMVCPRLRTLGSPSDGRFECSRLFWLSLR